MASKKVRTSELKFSNLVEDFVLFLNDSYFPLKKPPVIISYDMSKTKTLRGTQWDQLSLEMGTYHSCVMDEFLFYNQCSTCN